VITLQSLSGGAVLNFKRLTFLRGWNYFREGALQKLKFSYLWRVKKFTKHFAKIYKLQTCIKISQRRLSEKPLSLSSLSADFSTNLKSIDSMVIQDDFYSISRLTSANYFSRTIHQLIKSVVKLAGGDREGERDRISSDAECKEQIIHEISLRFVEIARPKAQYN